MPMSLWIDVNQKLEFTKMLISGRFDLTQALKHRQIIQDKVIDMFGVSEHIKSIIRKKIWIEKEWEKVLLKGEKHRKVYIEIEEKNLEEMENEKETVTFMESVISMKAVLKYDIDPKKVTIEEYFTTVKFIEKQNKKENGRESNKIKRNNSRRII